MTGKLSKGDYVKGKLATGGSFSGILKTVDDKNGMHLVTTKTRLVFVDSKSDEIYLDRAKTIHDFYR